MYRFLALALVAMLVACTSPGTDDGAAASPASPRAGSTAAPGGTAGETAGSGGTSDGTVSAECEEAFAPLAEMEVTSLTDLGDVGEVEATVESCESLTEWIAAAEQALGIEVNPATAEMLLGMRCSSPSLSNTPLCTELAGS